MFKARFYIPALFMFGAVQAQTPKEKAKIINSYDSRKTELLNQEIKAREASVQNKIDEYLSKNPTEKQYFSVDGVSHRIVDIYNGKPIYQSTDNALAARAIKTNHLYPGGSLGLSLEGEGMDIALWDGGWVLTTHVEFMEDSGSRVVTPDSFDQNPAADSHGTHVGGSIGAKGVSSSAKGMAPKSNIRSFNWTFDQSEVSNEASTNGTLITNHSYGVYVENAMTAYGAWYMGCYSTAAVNWDQIAYNYPYTLITMSAGNGGTEIYSGGLAPGYDKLTGEKNSKNLLIVANANPTVDIPTGNITGLTINNTSSQGPSDDGRIKPDISSDGTDVYSTNSTGTTNYYTASGTSMASPTTAGTMLLLQEHYNNLHPSEYMRAATLKGLVCHTALDDSDVIGWASAGPDPKFGWGLLDARAAANVLTNSIESTPTAIVDERNLAQGGSYSFQVTTNSPKKLMASICWTDLPGTAKNNQLNSPTPALVNDLDIRITKDDETYYPWKLDLSNLNVAVKGDNVVDNFERVDVDNAIGTYTIQVTHKGTLPGGSQNYSLIVSGFDSSSLSTESFKTDNLFVYPNPASDMLYFSTTENASLDKVEIYDTIGKRVLSSQINNNSVDISQLTSGVYFVKIYSGESQVTKKIIKK